MTYKKGVNSFLFFVLLFVVAHYVVWKNWTELLLTNQYPGGDLARIGYATKQKRITRDDLPRRHLEMKDYRGQQIDLLTFGDSFSQGGGGGLNRYYQDAIASATGMTVLNVYPYREVMDKSPRQDLFEPVRTLLGLLHSGYIDKIMPKYVLLESVERKCGERFGSLFNPLQSVPLGQLEAYYRRDFNAVDRVPDTYFINSGNLKFVYYNLRYRIFGKGHPTVPRMALTQALFSGEHQTTVLYHVEDEQFLRKPLQQDVETMNKNLNLVADLLAQKGIKLYFMPVVDKFNLYRPYMVRTDLPQSSFFEKIRPLPKRYQLIDTKALLADELKRGELDIFHYDDTHWTWKASQAIARQTDFSVR